MDSFDVGIAIIGSGFAGLGMAIRLKQEGIDDFVVLERGGRRRRHLARQHLPGLRLRRAVAPLLVLVRAQPGLEPSLLAASRRSATTCGAAPTRYGLRPHVRFEHRASPAARWDDDERRWQIETTAGPLARAGASSLATGPLGRARRSRRSPGLDDLRGRDVPLRALGPRLRPRAASAWR